MNCYNSLRRVAKKGTIFDNLKTITQERDMKTRKMTPFFLSFFSSPSCLGNSFLHLSIVKIHFDRGPPLTHSDLQNIWILIVKAVRLGFCPVGFKKPTHWGKQKTRFYFFYRVENKFWIFQGNIMVYLSYDGVW